VHIAQGLWVKQFFRLCVLRAHYLKTVGHSMDGIRCPK
jgi:hypothetical protein